MHVHHLNSNILHVSTYSTKARLEFAKTQQHNAQATRPNKEKNEV